MKVISIIQPWATLIAIGEKKFETRSWSTKYRGELAIHASKKIDKAACRREPFRSVLAQHGYTEANLPVGVILARCKLDDSLLVREDNGTSAIIGFSYEINGNEYSFGDYSKGRFAWELIDVKALDQPIPAKGQLGLWEYPQILEGLAGT
jgi:hypothetical protein